MGNLTERGETSVGKMLTETFTYDTLNRLTGAQVTGRSAQTVAYDALGNIKTKTGVGTYTYGAGTAGPHAVTRAGTDTYTYDKNGNQLTGAGRTLTYHPFNKVKSIVKGTHTTAFVYGPERTRYKRTDVISTGRGTSTTTTLYLGSVEKVIAPDRRYTYKRYITDGVLIEQTHDTSGNRTGESTCYLLYDHLGSVDVITNVAGTVVQDMSFDAWGQRRAPDDWTVLALLRLTDTGHGSKTPYGFTGHEMLDAVGIIHMNGRIYDPRLGRFMQADPIIQFPDYSQSWNRYSYVLNNPLNATDPSGYIFKKLFKGLNKLLGDFAPFLSIALLAIPGVQPWVVESWIHAFQFGFLTGGIATGSFKGALFGGISAAAFSAIGQHFSAVTGLAEGGVAHILTHGLAGGILAELQGGQFGHGFLAAGLSKAVMGRFKYDDVSTPAVLGRTAIAATVGGTISRITGGKFANGALTSAMAQLFNAERTARARGLQQRNDTWDPATNERIEGLHPDIQENAINFINEVETELGIQLRVTQGMRTTAEQDALYAQGRTTSGQIVTNARGGESYHNYGLAIDVVEIRNNQAVWNTNWTAIGEIGIRHGFEWGGNWTIPDRPHFQRTLGLSINELRSRAKH